MSTRRKLRHGAVAAVMLLQLSAASAASVGLPPSDGAQEAVVRHLDALGAIAVAHGGTRASGTPGYDLSVEYVAEQLRDAGYVVAFEEFTFPFFEERAPPVLAAVSAAMTIAQNRDALRILQASGSGDVTARLQPVDLGPADGPAGSSTSGCEREDFARFESGRIALLRRGACPFQIKVEHATAAGAAGIVIMNEGGDGQTGVFGGRLTTAASLPVLATTTEIGRLLQRAADTGDGIVVRLTVSVEAGVRSTRNVLAEMPGRDDAGPVVVVGAHLDSVPEGPGINDNGSGTAATLEAALRLARDPVRGRALRFAFWGAEERGLIGSRHHVGRLSEEERKRIALYINLDMVGSPNPGRFLRSNIEAGPGVATDLRLALAAYFRDRDLPVEERASTNRRRVGGGSDDASFAQQGIATIMLYTGAGEQKGEPQAAQFGGTAGRAYDPCYHQACDTVANIDRATLAQMAEALFEALRQLPGRSETPPRN